jgi:23S rRNA pseudoU1915 N3-methylase RlmH
MKKLFTLSSILIFICFFGLKPVYAQKVKNHHHCVHLDTIQLKAQKKAIKAKEKHELKKEVEKIERELKKGKITRAGAKRNKQAAAEKHAKNIEDQLNIIDAEIALIKRNGGKNEGRDYYKNMTYLTTCHPDTIKTITHPHRTHSHFIVAFGLDNAVGKSQSLNDSPYRVGGSRFFEIGYEFSTVLIKSGYLRFNYGIDFQFNGLKPTGNRYFVRKGDQAKLEHFPYNLRKAKLRQDNFVIPMYVEIGPTDKTYRAKRFKLGLGGYAGLNLRTIQKLKYHRDGHHIKRREAFSPTTNNFIYGLGAYVGYNIVELYFKYDLNAIFRDNPVAEHNVTFGLRFVF